MLHSALSSDDEEKEKRLSSLKRFATKFTLERWSQEVIARFRKEAHRIESTPPTTFVNFEELACAYKSSKKRIFFLDYDVT